MEVDYSGMAENLKSDLKKAIEQNKETLKPCPFCGGEAMLTNQLAADQYGHKLWNVICVKCDNGTMGYWDKKHVVDKWNTRKPVEEVVEQIEKEADKYYTTSNSDQCVRHGMKKAIEIIKEGMG